MDSLFPLGCWAGQFVVFSHLGSAEGSLSNRTHSVTHSNQYQWFAHDLESEVFAGEISNALIEKLGDYFVERVNRTLVSPYSVRFENPLIKSLASLFRAVWKNSKKF